MFKVGQRVSYDMADYIRGSNERMIGQGTIESYSLGTETYRLCNCDHVGFRDSRLVAESHELTALPNDPPKSGRLMV